MGKLSDTLIRNFKAQEKAKKLTDGEGLYLYVLPSGGKSWRIDYAFEKSRRTLTLGMYPVVTLLEARQALLELKIKLKNGIDPQGEKKAIKQAQLEEIENSFEAVANAWFNTKQTEHSPKHQQDVKSKLERFIYPDFRTRNINSITAKEMLEVIRKIEKKGIYETTKKVLGICNQICSFAVGEGKADNNVCSGLSNQIKTVKSRHYPFITDRKLFGQLLRDIDNYPHNFIIKKALQIAPLVFVRPGELINATWAEIDFYEQFWTIPEERMKLRKKHVVPLSNQVIKLLKELREITGDNTYLFANWNNKDKPFTLDGVRKALVILGYPKDVITTHGFRHTASTMLNELGYNGDHIEKQLAHTSGNTVRATYNHAQYLPERRKMMQEWADFCNDLKEKAKQD